MLSGLYQKCAVNSLIIIASSRGLCPWRSSFEGKEETKRKGGEQEGVEHVEKWSLEWGPQLGQLISILPILLCSHLTQFIYLFIFTVFPHLNCLCFFSFHACAPTFHFNYLSLFIYFNFPKFWFPKLLSSNNCINFHFLNLNSNFRNFNFHINLFNHYHFTHLFICLFLKIQHLNNFQNSHS